MTKQELLDEIEKLHHDWRSLDPQRALERLEFIKVEAMVRALPDDEAQGDDPEIEPCPECGELPDMSENDAWVHPWVYSHLHCELWVHGKDRRTALARWNAMARAK